MTYRYVSAGIQDTYMQKRADIIYWFNSSCPLGWIMKKYLKMKILSNISQKYAKAQYLSKRQQLFSEGDSSQNIEENLIISKIQMSSVRPQDRCWWYEYSEKYQGISKFVWSSPVAMDNGARKALIPIENKRNFLDSNEPKLLLQERSPIHYGGLRLKIQGVTVFPLKVSIGQPEIQMGLYFLINILQNFLIISIMQWKNYQINL
jgi:hypothetical protein